MMKKILKVVGIGIVVIIAIGIFGGKKETTNVSNEKVVDNKTESTTTTEGEVATITEVTTEITTVAEEVVQVTAKDLLESYKANEIKGDELYKDKKLEVTGIIGTISKDFLDNPYVNINSGEDFELFSVQCSFKDKDEIAKLGDLRKGDEITITGTNSGYTLNVILKDCKIN